MVALADTDIATTSKGKNASKIAPLSKRLPLITKLTLISLLIPVQFELGPILLTPSRLIFLITVPMYMLQLFSGRFGRLISSDYMVLAYGGWMALAVVYHAPGILVTFVGSNVLIVLGGYSMARATIRCPEQFYEFVGFLSILIVLMIPLGMPELLNPDYTRTVPNMLVPPLIEDISWLQSGIRDVLYPPREAFGMAFDRAQAVFPHPIHLGLFCTGGFALVLVGMRECWGLGKRLIVSGLILFACFMTLSSGPLLALFVQLFLAGYGWIMSRVPNRWRILSISTAIFYSVLEVFSTRLAIFAIVSYISFAPHTAYVRRTLFELGIQEVMRHPLIGIGFGRMTWLPRWMSGSLDNQWLMMALLYGIPCFLFLFLCYVLPLVQAGRRDFSARPDLNAIRLSWILVIISLILTMFTVALWGVLYSYNFMVLGAGAWLVHYSLDTGDKDDTEDKAPRSTSRYTRFRGTSVDRATSRPRAVRSKRTRNSNLRRRTSVMIGATLLAGLTLFAGTERGFARDVYLAPPGTVAAGGDGSETQPFADLYTALRSGVGGGDRILLMQGAYGLFQIKGFGDLGGLEILPAPGATVHMDRILFYRSGNLRLGGTSSDAQANLIQVWPLGFPVTYHPLISVDGESADVHLHDLDIRAGADATSYRDWDVETWTGRMLDGARLYGQGGSLTRSRIIGTRFAITAFAPDIQVVENHIEGFSADALRGLGNNNVFTDNRIKDCIKIDGNHDDAFQSWAQPDPEGSADTTKRIPVVGLRIERNVILEWDGQDEHPLRCVLQGIGLFDGPYDDVVIRNNLVVVSSYHGITAGWVRKALITHNTVAHPTAENTGRWPWIGVFLGKKRDESENATVANNIANLYKLETLGPGGVASQNLVAPRAALVYRDPRGGDWRVKPTHSANGAADPKYLSAVDVYGAPRPQGAGGDLGAIETDAAPTLN